MSISDKNMFTLSNIKIKFWHSAQPHYPEAPFKALKKTN
jgi:hypothetical protein